MKREFLMLAQKYDDRRVTIAGWYMSEKLDGMRCFWDGGVTRGLETQSVPFANTEKDSRFLVTQKATGLWSRHGKAIQAPDWWLAKLPPYPLDGELYIRLNSFQELSSIVKTLTPGRGWESVKYKVFDIPSPGLLFSNGHINNPNFKKHFNGVLDWYLRRRKESTPVFTMFESAYDFLSREIQENDVVSVLEQTRLPFKTQQAQQVMLEKLEEVTNKLGEGLILRKPSSIWEPERSWNLLKVKKLQDTEGVVIGYVSGKETDKGSKLLGMMGSLSVKFGGIEFDLSGFTEEERTLTAIIGYDVDDADRWLRLNPGMPVPEWITSTRFPRGSVVTFRYRELTDAGKPKEARYWRKRS